LLFEDEISQMVLGPDLDRIDWSSTSHAYGPATDVPKYLRGLASADAKTQDWALGELSWTIYHQGSVYPAAVEAVPFLAKLLRSPQIKRKGPALEILQLLAEGAGWAQNHGDLAVMKEAIARSPEFADKIASQLKNEQDYVPRLHARIREYLPIYLTQLQDENLETRLQATALLMELRDLVAQSSPALEAVAQGDSEPAARANALIALAKLKAPDAETLLKRAAEMEQELLPRLAALGFWFWVAVAPRNASDHLQALHRIIVDAPPSLREEYEALPCAGEFDSDMVLSLTSAGPEHARQAMVYLIPQLRGRRYPSESSLMALLCAVQHADGKIREGHPLTNAQAQALRIVADVAWPTKNHTHGNAVDVLERFGLPTERTEIEQLLSSGYWSTNTDPAPKPSGMSEAVTQYWASRPGSVLFAGKEPKRSLQSRARERLWRLLR
jgi:hypothetical protein